MLNPAQIIDAILGSFIEFEHDWDSNNIYEKLFDGQKRNFGELIGKKVEIPLLGDVEIVFIQATEPVTPDEYTYDTPFYQGYEGEGFIIIKVQGETYKKPFEQDSYGQIHFRTIEDKFDWEQYGLQPAKPTQTTIEVWT